MRFNMENALSLLRALEKAQGADCPLSALSSALGLDKAALKSAASALVREGYPVRWLGSACRMEPDADRVTGETLACWLPDRAVFAYETLDSTNAEARRRPNAPPGSLFVAETQTAGRGRMGKSFFSPGQSGLYMSLVLAAPAPEEMLLTTPAAAVAVCEALEALTPLCPRIKWLNDLYLGGKKVCGILTEAVADAETQQIRRLVVGIGINCRGADFPPELAEIAGSLNLVGVSRSRLAGEIVRRLEDRMAHLGSASLMAAYRARSLMPGRRVRYQQNGQFFAGTAEGVDDQGRLLVRLEGGGLAALDSGEVQLTDWEREK